MSHLCFFAPGDMSPADHDHEEDSAAAERNLWNRPVRQEGLLRGTGMHKLRLRSSSITWHVNFLVCKVSVQSGLCAQGQACDVAVQIPCLHSPHATTRLPLSQKQKVISYSSG